jgi:hypothetical protein
MPFTTQAQDKQTIRFTITKKGLTTTDVTMEQKRFTVPRGMRLRVVFEYADRNDNAHQFTVHSAKPEVTAQRMAPDGPTTSAVESP